ncbi:uncharacterized protein N7518_002676 [Penicillium psychrosexuale]|uniref:uncharacterized protein n=1 Tax=Penicillium psychrosexuale TaxID=1002107 RepID=UPI002544E0FA|nr:uncharacterized protein N7518_002676 [Penicillium psychrosexuale]KAJ5800608.1 hypothetical protein N7518_002676 [Penicillium psychrosexuale]
MSEMEAHPVLPKMIDEKITIHCPDSLNKQYATLYPTRTWLIVEKLSEKPTPIDPEDFDVGMGPAYTVGKYRCRDIKNDVYAFMRIYKQIPLAGTELDNLAVRRKQACKPRRHTELSALKSFTENGCTATPKLFGYQIGKQDENDLVPGGYIIYLVWEKVRGDSLSSQEFWSLPYHRRQTIRKNFKNAYMELLKAKYKPLRSTASNIILDKTTGDIKISGFKRAVYVPSDTKWKDFNFVMFFLALNSSRDYEHMAKDVEFGKHGWRW